MKLSKVATIFAALVLSQITASQANELNQNDPSVYTASGLANMGRCAMPAFSPDGKTIAFVSTMSGTDQVWTIPVEGGWPTQITAMDDTVIGEEWSPTSEWISLLLEGGDLNRPAYVVRSDGTGLKMISPGGGVSNTLCGWSPDGTHVLLSSNKRESKAFDSYFADPQTAKLTMVAKNEVTGILDDLSADNKYGVLWQREMAGDANLYRINLETGDKVLLTPHQSKARFSGGDLNRCRIRISKDGHCVYFLTNIDKKNMFLARIAIGEDQKAGPIEVLLQPADQDVIGFMLDRKGEKIAVIISTEEGSKLSLVDLTAKNRQAAPDLPVPNCLEMDWSPDSKKLALTLYGPVEPDDIWLLDLNSKRFTQLTHSQHPGINLANLVRPEIVHFTSQDGSQIKGSLYRPVNNKGLAPYVISLNHGSKSFVEVDVQSLLLNGIGVFCPEIRVVQTFDDRNLDHLTSGKAFDEEKSDIKAAVDYLIANKLAEPKRIGVIGKSFAGRLAMVAVTELPGLFAAGEEDYGLTNFVSLQKEHPPQMAARVAAALAKIKAVDPVLEEKLEHRLSVIERVDKIRAPILVQQGAKDTNVPAAQADELVEALKRNGKSVQYLSYPDEGHAFRKLKNLIAATAATTEFFVKYLKSDSN